MRRPRRHGAKRVRRVLLAKVQRKLGEQSVVERVLPEWRFTVAGEERLAIENDRRRTRELAGAA